MSTTSDSSLADPREIIADLRRQLAEARAERDEALEQQTATAEVLQVINSSPGDLAPVFEAILEKALHLCEANFGSVYARNGQRIERVASRGMPPEYLSAVPSFAGAGLISPGNLLERMLGGENLISIPDLAEPEVIRLTPRFEPLVRLAGARSFIAAALRKNEPLLGFIAIYRRDVRSFSDKQIVSLQNFAAQAVIAMENARLLGELREQTGDLQQSLEYQTATGDVLKVISRSTFDLNPVLESVMETAVRLCRAEHGSIFRLEGGVFRWAVGYGLEPAYREIERNTPIAPSMGTVVGRTALAGHSVQIADAWSDPDYAVKDDARLGQARTMLGVPLVREGTLIGVIAMARRNVEPFTEKEVELVSTFADQAVIAIENVRLLTETREALEQQTATAEVLGVINSSPGDLAPVFDAMLERAIRLCDAVIGTLWIYDSEQFRLAAISGGPPNLADILARSSYRYDRMSEHVRALRDEYVTHVLDARTSEAYLSGDPVRRAMVDIGGGRTLVTISLQKDGEVLGIFTLYRQDVRPFTEKQIALLTNFAAQAVIAIENARLITETREALEQQTATAEVLQVINSSPGDLAPVFDAMLEKALRLCEAPCGHFRTFDGELLHLVADRGVPEPYAEFLRTPVRPHPDNPLGRMLRGERVVVTVDAADDEPYRTGDPVRRAYVELGGARSAVSVALVKDDKLLGTLTIYRQEFRPFTDKQIALLQSFAAQAVIAMENARLLGDLRERTDDLQQSLEYQTATSDVLKVISRSSFDLQPVLDIVVETAVRLCQADQAFIFRRDGSVYRLAASFAFAPAYEAIVREQLDARPPNRGSITGRTAIEGRVVHVHDVSNDPEFAIPGGITIGKIRTALGVPLLRQGETTGVITLSRQQVQPFTDRQIELICTFADQAVIAIENARLLGELRDREAELRVTFDNMADGVAMFDETLHLAAWNRNFQELIQLSDEFLAAPHDFDEYIRYLTQRGEFGDIDPETQIKRLRERIGDHYSFERIRPDGKVIEIRNNPMPNGGIVVIYSDITERKRSEEEIRTARDIAEATLRDLRAAQANLIQAEKMASLGQLTAGIAHEIKNPLNFVNNFASLSNELLEELKEEAEPALATLDGSKRAEIDETLVMLSGNLEKIAEHGQRADNIVKSMLEHSRGVSGERREVDLNNLIDEALNLAYHGARAQDASFNVTLERDFASTLKPIELAPQEITRVFLNLFGNGFYAANKRARENGGGTFRPSLTVATHDVGDAVEVRVRDNGTGIPADIRDKLFQPFFTTKPTGEGTGLGLSISYDIITQQHGGTITVESEPGSFTEFTVRLPRQ